MTTTDEAATVNALALDLCASLAAGPKSYADVMEAWRTSCPRLDVWETARDRGWIARRADAAGAIVVLTDAGRAALRKERAGADDR